MAPQNDSSPTPNQDSQSDNSLKSTPDEVNSNPAPDTTEPKPRYSMDDPDGEPPVVSEQQAIQHVEDSPDTVASNQVVAVSSPDSPAKSKKKLIAIITAVVVFLGAGGASAFMFLYNNPDMVVADALRQTLVAKSATANGNLNYVDSSEGDSTLNMTYQFATNEANQTNTDLGLSTKFANETYELKTQVVTDTDGKIFVKADNVKALLNSYLESSGLGSEMTTLFDGLISKVDGKWVVITPKDIQSDNTEADSETVCAQKALKTFQNDKKQQDEIFSVYKANPFISVSKNMGTETVDGKMSNHYELKADETKSKSFATAVTETDAFKAVDTCYKGELKKSFNESSDQSEVKDLKNAKVELWVDTFSHKPTKVKITSNEKSTTFSSETKINLGSTPSISIPKADTTVDDLKAEMTKIEESFMSSFGDGSYTTEDSFDTTVLGMSILR